MIKLLFAGIIIAIGAFADPGAKSNPLILPKKHQSLPPPEDNINLVKLLPGDSAGSRLLLIPTDRKLFVLGPINENSQSRVGTFGKWAEYERFDLTWEGKPTFLKGVWAAEDRIIFLDGVLGVTLDFSRKQNSIVNTRSIPWDLINPPKDSKGEGTQVEKDRLRAKFRRAFLGTKGGTYIGAERGPANFNVYDRHDFFVGTRVPEFPVITFSCNQNDSNCMVKSSCFLENQDKLPAGDLVGFSISEKRKQLLFLLKDSQSIVIFQYDSCFHSKYLKSVELPKKLKEATSIHVDSSDRLWLSTKYPDDYENSSVFYWNPEEW